MPSLTDTLKYNNPIDLKGFESNFKNIVGSMMVCSSGGGGRGIREIPTTTT